MGSEKNHTDDKGESSSDQMGQSTIMQSTTNKHNNKDINSDNELEDDFDKDQDSDIIQHPSYKQVLLDVNRCAGRLERIRQVYFHRSDDYSYASSSDLTNESLNFEDANETLHDLEVPSDTQSITSQDVQSQRELKKNLAKLIVRLLIKKKELHYYQGFHDVCLTYMILLGDDKKAEQKLDEMIDSHFNIYMQPTMNETQEYLALVPIIIGLMDSKVEEFLDKSEIGTIFALSWVITWFSHVISNESDIGKIYEFLENQDPHMVLYLSASIVISKKDKVLKLEPEMSAVHHYLTQLPRREKFDFDEMFKLCVESIEKWPPTLVKKKLEDDRRMKLYQVNNYNLMKRLANRLFEPYLTRFVSHHPRVAGVFRAITSPLEPFANSFAATNPRTAILVMVIASALIFQYDRWTR